MKRSYCSVSLGVALAVLAPVAAHAQVVISLGGGMTVGSGGDGSVNPPMASATGAGISADSLKALWTLAETKHTVIVIDKKVATLKELKALTAAQIGSVELRDDEVMVKVHGEKAKNGVLVVKTRQAAPAKGAQGGSEAPAGGGSQIQGEAKFEFKTQ